jgi:hypothetical protein
MGLTDEQAARLDKVVQAIWDGHVDAVQAAKAAVRTSRRAWRDACTAHTRAAVPLRRRALTGRLSDTEADQIVAAEQAVADAHADVDAARVALAQARERFKAGVTDTEIEEVLAL